MMFSCFTNSHFSLSAKMKKFQNNGLCGMYKNIVICLYVPMKYQIHLTNFYQEGMCVFNSLISLLKLFKIV